MAGLLLETLLSGLIAPVMMIFQSIAVGEILLGRDAGWQVQRRDEGGLPLSELLRRYALPTVFGVVMAAVAYAVSLPLLFWMAPVIAGLMMCIPIALLSSAIFHGSRLLVTPEQTAPPDVLIRANELMDRPKQVVAPALIEIGGNPELLEAHLANLPQEKQRIRGQVDPHLAIARAKIEDAETFEETLSFLTTREVMAVLNSDGALRAVVEKPRVGFPVGMTTLNEATARPHHL